jgi:prepilin-type processing-associated H-X9-DG protein
LIELLVVIAIIGVLIGLLLPAVQKVREAANRMSCTNNLKQIGVAAHAYHDTYNSFPPGCVQLCPNPGSYWGGEPALTTWAIELLPYIEQGNLYQRYDKSWAPTVNCNVTGAGLYQTSPNNVAVLATVVKPYVCPSDPNGGQRVIPASGSMFTAQAAIAISSYAGMSGATPVGFSPATTINYGWWDVSNILAAAQPPAGQDNSVFDAILYQPPPDSWRGLFHVVNNASWPQKVRNLQPEAIAGVVDGTSNTIAVTEYETLTRPDKGKFWGYGRNSYTLSAAMIPQASRIPDWTTCSADENNDASSICERAFASMHSGGANAVFCDGSARFLSNNLDGRVFMALATIAGGEVLPNY